MPLQHVLGTGGGVCLGNGEGAFLAQNYRVRAPVSPWNAFSLGSWSLNVTAT